MHFERETNTTGLDTALATLAQQKCFGREKKYSIESRLFALQEFYGEAGIKQALNALLTEKNSLSKALHTALLELQPLLETLQKNTLNKQDESELQLENKADRLYSQWQSENTAVFEQGFAALQEREKESHGSAKAGWYSVDLLARITLQHADHSAARSCSLQALHLAQESNDLEKTEKSEFIYACAHSSATADEALRDNFVNARDAVIAERSLLRVDQQHHVMIYSARDFERRTMSSSASWVLQLCAEREAHMLAPTRLMYWRESTTILRNSGAGPAASEAQRKANALEQQLSSAGPAMSQADKSVLLQRLQSLLTTQANTH